MRVFVVLSFILLTGASGTTSRVWAQTYQGGVRGAVYDSTGIIPGAAVTLTNTGTNQARQTTTNELGQYVLANVPPGVYALSVHVDGFKPTRSPVSRSACRTSM